MLPSHGNDNHAVRAARWGVLVKGCRMQKVSEAPFIVENCCVLYVPIRGHHSQLLHAGDQPLVG